MPEGDTLWKVAEALRPLLLGKTIAGAWLRGPTRRPELEGAEVRAVESVGKHLVIALADGRSIRSHLGMRGSWHRYLRGSPWQRPASQASLVLETDRHSLVCFHAPAVEVLVGPRSWSRPLASLGPDLAAGEVDLDVVLARARGAGAAEPIAEALLDQSIAAGIGNVFKSEILFLERVSPFAPLGEIDDARLRGLYGRARTLLLANLRPGLRSTRPAPAGEGETTPARRDAARHWVYLRGGMPCFVCGAAIAWTKQGDQARSTWWCPRCQPAPGAAPRGGGVADGDRGSA